MLSPSTRHISMTTNQRIHPFSRKASTILRWDILRCQMKLRINRRTIIVLRGNQFKRQIARRNSSPISPVMHYSLLASLIKSGRTPREILHLLFFTARTNQQPITLQNYATVTSLVQPSYPHLISSILSAFEEQEDPLQQLKTNTEIKIPRISSLKCIRKVYESTTNEEDLSEKSALSTTISNTLLNSSTTAFSSTQDRRKVQFAFQQTHEQKQFEADLL